MIVIASHSPEQTDLQAISSEAKSQAPSVNAFACGSRDPNDLTLPAHLMRELSPVRPTLSDATSKRIAQLFRLHPALDNEFHDFDLIKIGSDARKRLLADIEARLGVV
jgi:hypothetical protein